MDLYSWSQSLIFIFSQADFKEPVDSTMKKKMGFVEQRF
jgi:hypothetical protein